MAISPPLLVICCQAKKRLVDILCLGTANRESSTGDEMVGIFMYGCVGWSSLGSPRERHHSRKKKNQKKPYLISEWVGKETGKTDWVSEPNIRS